MKKLMITIAAVALLASPVFAGPPAESRSEPASVQLRHKLSEIKKAKAQAMSGHVLEAELMKEVKRGSLPPVGKTDSCLADRGSKKSTR